jgi:acetylornithine deacetylase/succinyl-diaminopimelate desuccinylase-like protein
VRPVNKIDLREAFSLVDEVRVLKLAKELIRVPSVTGDEREIMHRARDLLEDSGLPVEFRGSKNRPIVLSTINPKASPFLVFNGHLDIVPVADRDA